MNLEIGDKVVVTDDNLLHSAIRNGDTGVVIDMNDFWVTFKVNGISQNLPNDIWQDSLTKVDIIVRKKYTDPGFIIRVKNRVKEIELRQKMLKFYYKNSHRFKFSIGYHDTVIPYLRSRQELNYCYTILRQYNEMKRMYAKLRIA